MPPVIEWRSGSNASRTETQEAENARRKFGTYKVGMHIPHSIYTKIPEKSLVRECRTEIKEIIKRLLEMYKLELVEGAVCIDHIHISIRIPPKYAVSKIMGMLKGKSAMMLFDRHPEWRKRTGRDKTFWAR